MPNPFRGGLKKIMMEFSIKLAGWVIDDPVFHKKKMVLKHFI